MARFNCSGVAETFTALSDGHEDLLPSLLFAGVLRQVQLVETLRRESAVGRIGLAVLW